MYHRIRVEAGQHGPRLQRNQIVYDLARNAMEVHSQQLQHLIAALDPDVTRVAEIPLDAFDPRARRGEALSTAKAS
ncbi:hypothetical protein H8B02_13070 [Bradyrhizobium sp. Pear77]|uniref:hypothetical protein n=1 Tax=Bradyrhizobium altum TaxID=1571202 RepID=UPI001E3E15E8|nr:hypothetical protein [Bradyrhizobium altum]MCC8954349.1 hypothetical protein [Bradyrhizobium altum]